MKLAEKLKTKAKSIKKQLTAVYYAYQDPEVKLLPKIIIVICMAYALSPIDLIPDFIPVLGYLDDLIIIPALIGLAIKLIPHNVMEEAKIQAEQQPLKLRKNWIFAAIFIIIWIVLIATIVNAMINIFNRE